MFTGIVEDIGTVQSMERKEKGAILTFQVDTLDLSDLELGDSIAVNGTCLTVISFTADTFTVEASHETLAKTNLGRLKTASRVNLECALRMGDKLGGHMVSGHVDGVGGVKSINPEGDSIEFVFTLPGKLAKYIVEKGSVAVDGVSLTVNTVRGNEFGVNIIPHTQSATIFGELKPGGMVNIECDMIGKYVEKFVTGNKNNNSIYQFQDESD